MSYASLIYSRISELFGTGQQFLTMEFPGRVLKKESYLYKTDTPYAVLNKPQIVLEEEFRLVDDMFDIYTVVGGPSGRKLSVAYELALNSFAPKFPESSSFMKDQAKIRHWLLELIKDKVGDKEFIGSRMELFHELNEIYLEAKASWEKQKNEEFKKRSNEDYSRWLANYAPVMEAKIEALYDDLVVRGYYHEVKTDLSYLDIKTAAEQLEDSKARMRNSCMSSLDESETIYPIQLQPLDWAEALDTNFTPEDLTHSAEFLQLKLIDKKNELADLQTQFQMLAASKTGDIKKLQEDVDKARDVVETTKTQLLQTYSDSIVTIANIVIKKLEVLPTSDESLIQKATTEINEKINSSISGIPITPENVVDILKTNDKIQQAQANFTKAVRILSYAQMKEIEARSTDTKLNQIALQSQMDDVNREIKHLEAIIFSPTSKVLLPKASTAGPDDKPEVALLPNMPAPGRWTDIIINYKKEESTQEETLSSASLNVDVNSIFGLVKGTNETAWSNFASNLNKSTEGIDIGFRATKVTINRGGWFNPEFFTFTSGMFRLLEGEEKISGKTPSMIEESELKDLRNCLLPAYPVSFIIAKDVTISIELNETVINDAKSAFESQSVFMTNVCCFATASVSSASSSSKESHYSGIVNNRLIVKIPGPQIIGWFQEFVPEDRSTKQYVNMPADFLPEDDDRVVKPNKKEDKEQEDKVLQTIGKAVQSVELNV